MRALPILAFIGGLLAAPSAFAQTPKPPSAEDAAFAEQLFNEGRQLLVQKRYEEACSKFSQSLQLDRAMGTLGNYAFCNEQLGKYASAWGAYKEVVDRSTAQPERAATARARADALEPRLSHLHVVVPPEARVDGLEVRIDGRLLPVGGTEWNIPVDGGVRQLEFRAPGREPAKQSVTVAPERARAESVVPVLAPAVAPPEDIATAKRETSLPPPPWTVDPVVSYSVVGAGAAALIAGTVCGIVVAANAHKVKDDKGVFADRTALYDQLQINAWVANIGIPVGTVAIGVGVYLLSRAPGKSKPPSAAHRLLLEGRF